MVNIIEYGNISILINHKKGFYNDKNWACMKKRYEFLMPNAEICLGDYPENNYSKSTAINNAAKNSKGDTFIIANSNIAFNFDSIKKGLDMLKQCSFVIPYGNLIHLNQESTSYFHSLPHGLDMNEIHFSAYKREPAAVGHIFMVTRDCFEAIEGFNEDITEWDEENIDFANRLYDKFDDYERLSEYFIWSLFYEKINYPSYMKGINVEKIFKMKYPLGGISWDIRI